MCIACDEQLTFEHILLFCSDFIDIRETFYSSATLGFVPEHVNEQYL